MWLFLASELPFFGALLFAYALGRARWNDGFGVASQHTDVLIGTLNTALLLVSSTIVALAVDAAERGRRDRTIAALLSASAVLGAVFLALKGIEYRDEWQESLFPGPGFALAAVPGAQMFFALYFIATAVHALHLVAGIALLGLFAIGRARHRAWAGAVRLEAAGLYWHFVDIVWIVLYPLIYLVHRQP
jgi:cytochrome c oxidase subunit 3